MTDKAAQATDDDQGASGNPNATGAVATAVKDTTAGLFDRAEATCFGQDAPNYHAESY